LWFDVWTRAGLLWWNSGSGLLQMCEMLIIFCDDFELFYVTFSNHFCDKMNVLHVDEPGEAHVIK